jgi:hypothetical protein
MCGPMISPSHSSSTQRRFRNTLLFAAADEALLATAREAMRKAIAWDEICNDKRLQAQITQAQLQGARGAVPCKARPRLEETSAAHQLHGSWHSGPGDRQCKGTREGHR